MGFINSKTALLLIDIQNGFDNLDFWGGKRNNPEAEKVASKLLKYWRSNDLPVIHVKHCSVSPGSLLAKGQDGNNIKDIVAPLNGEDIYEKSVNSAFIGTNLEDDLRRNEIDTIVVAGLTTDHCISTSVRMGANLGFKVYLVENACATFDKVGVNGEKFEAQLIHDTALASLKDEFAQIISSEKILSK